MSDNPIQVIHRIARAIEKGERQALERSGVSFQPGDNVTHPLHGEGTVTLLRPGTHLIDVCFPSGEQTVEIDKLS